MGAVAACSTHMQNSTITPRGLKRTCTAVTVDSSLYTPCHILGEHWCRICSW